MVVLESLAMPQRRWSILALLILSQATNADDAKLPMPERVVVRLEARAELVPLPPIGDLPTFVAVPITRLVDAASGRVFDPTDENLGFVPSEIRRTFRLESANVLLGEPILIEFRTEVGERSRWLEGWGGNSRGALRDDSFFFALRDQDGTWVADTFDAYNPGHFGGMGGTREVSSLSPEVEWHALQAWSAIDRPGEYELFALHWTSTAIEVGHDEAITAALTPKQQERYFVNPNTHEIFDNVTNGRATDLTLDLKITPSELRPRSPIADRIRAEVGERFPNVVTATEFARLPLTIRPGTPAERQAMVERWVHLPEVPVKTYQEREQREAHDTMAHVGMALARQGDFLPEFAAKVADGQLDLYPAGMVCIGLALRNTPEATALLLDVETPNAIHSVRRYLPADQIASVIPRMIDLLTALEGTVRDGAAGFLRERTGEDFGVSSEQLAFRHLTADEGRTLQPRYRAWWDAHRATFQPRPAPKL